MKLKPLKESPSDICICGHTRKEHYHFIYEHEPRFLAKMKKAHGSWFNPDASGCSIGSRGSDDPDAPYCHCSKYIDLRHCKIKIDDPVLNALSPRVAYGQQDLIEATGVSWATVSRRISLFDFLKLLIREGTYGWCRSVYGYRIDMKRYHELVDQGVIA